MGRLYAGTSGWAYTSWKPGFYPQAVPARKFLNHYAGRLNTVEVNYTFRSAPSTKQVDGWLQEAGDGFRFSFKAPQAVTHLRRLRDCEEPWNKFLDSIQQVREAGCMGVVLLQFPPNFRADAKGKDKRRNADALAGFLEQFAAECPCRIAAEFRDAGWFSSETLALLRRHNVALCWAESDDLVTPREQTADFCYLRLRCSGYTDASLDELRNNLLTLISEGDVFAYFKHEEAPDGPLRAEKLLLKG